MIIMNHRFLMALCHLYTLRKDGKTGPAEHGGRTGIEGNKSGKYRNENHHQG